MTEQKINLETMDWGSTFDSITDLVSIHDENFTVLKVNKACCEFFKMDEKLLVGKKCHELFHETDTARDDCPHKVAFITKRPVNMEIFEPSLKLYFDVSASPIFGAGREVVGTMHIARDITVRKTAEKKLRESEENYRHLAENIGDMVIKTDTGGNITYVSPSFERCLGKGKEVLGTSAFDAVHPDDRAGVVKIFGESVRTKTERKMEYRYLHPEKGYLWLESVGKLTSDYAGVPYALIVTRDVTERKKAEAALQESEDRYRAAVETSPDMIFWVNPFGDILDCNKTAMAVLKYAKDQLVGRPIFGICAEEFKIQTNKFFEEWHNTGILRNKEYTVTTRNGKRVDIDLNVNSIYNESGKILSSIFVLRDTTERNRVTEIQKKISHADRLMVIGQLAAGIVHEINNPAAFVVANISAMQRNIAKLEEFLEAFQQNYEIEKGRSTLKMKFELADVLSKDNLPKLIGDYRDMLSDGLKGMERITSIVKNLKVFSRIESDEVELVQINELINVAINMTYSEIQRKARLVKDLGVLPPIVADGPKIAQVIVNMLLNAAQSIQKGPVEDNKIKISTKSEGKEVVISIEDTGEGISPEVLPRIFDPFFTTKPRDVGTGLGLTLCTDIVAKHRGKIDVSTEVGKGTCFTVRLSVKADLVPKDDNKASRGGAKTAVKRGRLLIVDDEVLLLTAFKRMLDPDHEIIMAKSGMEALSILEKDRAFDVIICDIVMPDMDGIELYKKLALLAPEIINKIIFCSGSAFGTRSKNFKKSVTNLFLDKPVSMQQLKEAVEKYLK